MTLKFVQKIEFTLLAACLAVVTMIAGCARQPTSTNPKVIFAQSLTAAAGTCDTVSIGLKAGQDVIEKLRAQGVIEDEYYVNAHAYLVKIARANDRAIQAIEDARNGIPTADWRSAVLAVADAAGQDPATYGLKDATAKAELTASLAILHTVLQAIPASFSTK